MNKQILQLAIPNIISNLSVPLLGIVDTAIMGHLENLSYLAAMSLGGIIFHFIYWGFGFLRMGTTGLTAQAFGAKDKTEQKYVLLRALLLAFSLSLVLLLLQIQIAHVSFWLIDSDKNIEALARSYYDIRIYAAPATLMLYVFNGWFLGMQKSVYSLYLVLFANLLNLLLNILFVFHFRLNIDGIAYGTVLAQYASLFFALFLFLKKYSYLLRGFQRLYFWNFERIRMFFQMNRDLFIRTFCLIFVLSFFTASSASFGVTALVINTILLQFWSTLSYGVDGFSFAAESLVGKYIGAKNKKNLLLAVRYSFYWGFGLAFCLSVVFYFFERELLSIFTDKMEIIEQSHRFYFWIILAPFINTLAFLWDGIYIGATATKPMRQTMIFSTVIFLITYYFFRTQVGVNSLWIALSLFMFFRGLFLTLQSKKEIVGKVKWC